MKLLFLLIFLLPLKTFANKYSSESSGKETYNFSINTKDGYSKQIRKTEGTWTDSLGNYGINTCVGTLTQDNRKFTWKNGRKLMTVPFEEHPYSALAAWLKTDEGLEALSTIEKKLK